MEKKKTIILSSIILGVLVLTLGITYALFSYQETSNNTSQLIMGDIYMHYKENNQLILNNAMPQEGFKTLLTGYKVNPIMAEQDASDTTTELYACINLFQNEWEWDLDEGKDFESFCKGEGTSYGWTFQMGLDNGFFDEELLSLNIIQEETIEYTNIKLNPEMKNQTIEYENELTACVSFVSSWETLLDEGTTLETFCQGIGTYAGGIYFQEELDNGMLDNEFYFEYLTSNNVIIQDGENYVINPIMKNQTVGEINELMTCIGIFTSEGYEFDDGTTAESFCKGEGTYDGGITLKGEFEEAKDNIDYIRFLGSKLLDNNIILASVDLPYFEFTISGKNTYSEKDIYYDIKLDYGDPHETRNTRLEDNFLKFRLIEVNPDKTEKIIFDNKSYSSIENQKIHTEIISKNTMNEINKTYRLYMWINEDVVIGNIDEDYTIEEWNDVFASVKVNVHGEINNSAPLSTQIRKVLETQPDTTVIDETGTIYISGANESGLHNIFTDGTNEVDVPEKYKVDYNYVWYSGKLWRIVCLYPDGTMKLATDNPVTTIEFGEDNSYETSHVREWLNQEFLPTLYNYENIIKIDSLWNITKVDSYRYDGTMIPETNMLEDPIGLLNNYEHYKTQEILDATLLPDAYYPIELGYLFDRYSSWTLSSGGIVFYDDDVLFSSSNSTYVPKGVRPVINLKSTVKMSSGSGTKKDPYTIEGDMETPTTNTLINKRQSGEYIILENDKSKQVFRIISTEKINNSTTTKLVLNDYVQDVDKINDSSWVETDNLFLRFTDSGEIDLWSDVDKTKTDLWRGYLNNIWIKKTDSTYNEETGESEILEKGKYYLGVYDYDYSDNINPNPNYKTTVCSNPVDAQSLKDCIENGNIVDNVVVDDYVGLQRIGEMFATKPGKDIAFTALEKEVVSMSYLITPIFSRYSRKATPELSQAAINSSGGDPGWNRSYDYVMWARPTINLKSNLVIKSGNGTLSSPFVVGLPD